MTAAESPRRYIPRAPSPSVFEDHIDALRAELNDLVMAYRWIYPSGYNRPRRDTGERTRRDVSGAGGDLADSYDGLEIIRRRLASAGDNVAKSLALVKGASNSLGSAQGIIETASRATLVAGDPLEPSTSNKAVRVLQDWERGMTPTEAKAQQTKRAARVAEGHVPWAMEEVTG